MHHPHRTVLLSNEFAEGTTRANAVAVCAFRDPKQHSPALPNENKRLVHTVLLGKRRSLYPYQSAIGNQNAPTRAVGKISHALLLVLVFLGAASSQAAERVPDKNIGVRVIGNAAFDIRQITAWEEKLKTLGASQAGPRPLPRWLKISGVVTDNVNGHVVMYASDIYPPVFRRGSVFIKNVPGYPLPRQQAVFYAMDTGQRGPGTPVMRHEDREIYCDYGTPVTDAQAKQMFSAPPEKPKTTEQVLAQQSRVITYQLQQASNGLPSFQYEVGKRYMYGDGLIRDDGLARHWLTSALTNGYSAASNLLSRIPANPTPETLTQVP
jgi:hypothetical protein